MRTHRLAIVVLVAVALPALDVAGARAADYDGPFHRHYPHFYGRAAIGDCVHTRVETIGPLPGGPAEPVMRFADGVIESYDPGMLGQYETRPGDPIQLCLVSFSRNCGMVFADEQPGRTYATGNLRTGAAWTQPDLRSRCVGH